MGGTYAPLPAEANLSQFSRTQRHLDRSLAFRARVGIYKLLWPIRTFPTSPGQAAHGPAHVHMHVYVIGTPFVCQENQFHVLKVRT